MLLELHRDAQTLEDVFRSLTIGDERRNRQLGARPTARRTRTKTTKTTRTTTDDVDDAEDAAEDEKAAKADRS